jgi:GGDEF domain-containing protein
VELSAHYFEHPDRVRYAYRWSPGEAAFTELGDARSAVFSRLPDGRHQLELRATLVDDPSVSAIATSIEVEVLPAWHQTWWGRAALLLGLASLAYAVFAVRSRQIRQQAQALAREVRERTHELSAAKDALELANTQLQRQAGTDPLTGLDNRRRLFEIAAQWQAEGRRLAALLIDLDHFKRINDEHGHQIGDAVLADFATVMREVFGERTCCSRYGGEEFLQRVRTRQVATRGALALGYTASIGVAHGAVGENIEALIRRADQALYRAKEAGRDRCEIG